MSNKPVLYLVVNHKRFELNDDHLNLILTFSFYNQILFLIFVDLFLHIHLSHLIKYLNQLVVDIVLSIYLIVLDTDLIHLLYVVTDVFNCF